MVIISRPAAQAHGLLRYYTGKPCKHGHVAERFVSSKACSTCTVTRTRAWQLTNPETARECDRMWSRENPVKIAAKAARRRADQTNATPLWLAPAHHAAIVSRYDDAKFAEVISGDAYHVDHVVPLRGENVSGLHVPWNLRVIPAEDNVAKGNRYT